MDPEIVDDPDYGSDLVTGLLAIPTMSIATDLATMYGAAHTFADPTVPSCVTS